MARKTATVEISAEGRDKGKLFFITEMPAMQIERWATRALLALSKSGIDIPDDIASAGLAGVASLGMRALSHIDFHDAEPLLAEMLTCVQFIPDPNNRSFKRSDIETDIEEVATFFKLRAEVFSLHTNFFTPGVNSDSTTKTTGKQHEAHVTPNTKTFRTR